MFRGPQLALARWPLFARGSAAQGDTMKTHSRHAARLDPELSMSGAKRIALSGPLRDNRRAKNSYPYRSKNRPFGVVVSKNVKHESCHHAVGPAFVRQARRAPLPAKMAEQSGLPRPPTSGPITGTDMHSSLGKLNTYHQRRLASSSAVQDGVNVAEARRQGFLDMALHKAAVGPNSSIAHAHTVFIPAQTLSALWTLGTSPWA